MARIRNNYENSFWNRLRQWLDGTYEPFSDPQPEADLQQRPAAEPLSSRFPHEFSPRFRKWARFISAGLVSLIIICTLLITVSHLPAYGTLESPGLNEVSQRYLEKGLEETGATNFVAGMILDYRAFDTFGESCVLFTAVCCVFILLRIDHDGDKNNPIKLALEENDRKFEPKNDTILQRIAVFLVPVILLIGIYILLNGHLSAGGGFAGGIILGSGLVLNLLAFGFKNTERIFTGKTFRITTTCALLFYCLAKSYSFYTGANGLHSGIPLGTPGAIISSGLILPLNVCVGLVVACTMYGFYCIFRKGDF